MFPWTNLIMDVLKKFLATGILVFDFELSIGVR